MPKNLSDIDPPPNSGPVLASDKPSSVLQLLPQAFALRILLAVILAVACYLRLSHMDVMLWAGNDPASATMPAVRMALGQELPRHGLMYSVGVMQTPLEIYFIAPFMLFSQDPTWFPRCWAVLCVGAVLLCYLVGRRFFSEKVGLTMAALFAVAPWSVMFSRQAWAQGIVHGFAVALLWAWCQFLTRPRPWALFWVTLLTLFMAQIHLAAFGLIVMMVVAWVVLRFPLFWKPIVAAIAINFITVLPYIAYQNDKGWEDFRRAAAVMESFNKAQPYWVEGIHPQFGFPFPSRRHFDHLLNLMAGRQFEELNGLSTPAFDSLPAIGLQHKLSGLLKLSIFLAVVGVGVFLVRKARRSARLPYFDLSQQPILTVCLLWILVPWAFFVVTGMQSYVLYFSFMFPVAFLLVAWSLDRLQSLSAHPGAVVLTLLLVAVVCSQAIFVERLYRFWDREGGAQGTRGENYKHQLAVAEAIAARTESKTPFVVSDWPPQTPVHLGIQYILWWKLRNSSLPERTFGSPRSIFVVLDTRFRRFSEIPAPLDRLASTSFGPLRLYEVPTSLSGTQRP